MLNLALETREAYNVHYNYYDTNLNTITFKIDCNQVKVKWESTCNLKGTRDHAKCTYSKAFLLGKYCVQGIFMYPRDHLLVHVVSSYTSYAYIINVNHNSISTRYTFTSKTACIQKRKRLLSWRKTPYYAQFLKRRVRARSFLSLSCAFSTPHMRLYLQHCCAQQRLCLRCRSQRH